MIFSPGQWRLFPIVVESFLNFAYGSECVLFVTVVPSFPGLENEQRVKENKTLSH